jgi:hypothetical protein
MLEHEGHPDDERLIVPLGFEFLDEEENQTLQNRGDGDKILERKHDIKQSE